MIKSYFGLAVYMDLTALNELMDEGPQINGVQLAYDPAQEERLFAAVKKTPVVGAVTLQLGCGFAWATVQGFANDLYSVPFVILAATNAKAALIVIAAASASASIVRHRIDRFDLVAVLEARD